MKLAVFLVCYVLYIVQLHAQSTVDWVQTLGGSGEDRSEKIAVDGASNVYSIGYFRDTIGNLHSFGGADVLLTKHNADGQLLWMKQFGSMSLYPILQKMINYLHSSTKVFGSQWILFEKKIYLITCGTRGMPLGKYGNKSQFLER